MTGWKVKKEISIGNIITLLGLFCVVTGWVISVENRFVTSTHRDEALQTQIDAHQRRHN